MQSRSTPSLPFEPAKAEVFNAQLLYYISSSNFAWYVYDWLLSTSEEVEIFSRSGLSWSIVIYFLSRIGEFGHVLMMFLLVLYVGSARGCDELSVVLVTCAVVSMACTSLLFFFRVRAVYLQARYITVIFGSLWLAMVAVNIFDATSIRAEIIPGTHYCITRTVTYNTLPSISTFVYDTLVFLVISYRLAADAVAVHKGWRSRFLLIARGKGLYRLSGLLMSTGLFYYLAITFFFLVNVVMMESPLIHFTAQHFMLANEYISFTNIMACAAFRHVALCKSQGPSTDLTTTKIAAAMQMVPLSLTGRPPFPLEHELRT